ncbi:MAG: LptF/LptG family permease [bacterium]|nr:LptF/LptG family permease [bacterium]MDT8366050.1 LptF/LptG family permease [bacterium]
MPWKLYKYILNKFVSTFAAAIGVFTVLFLIDQASRQVQQLAPLTSSIKDFFLSFLLLAPPLLAYTIPLAFLISMIWTLEQMKQERELLAIMASGIAPLRLLTPFIVFSVFTFVITYVVIGYVGPASLRHYNTRLVNMARQSFINDLKPGALFDGIQGTLLLVGGFERDSGRIDGLVMIRSDLGEAEMGEIIIAQRGEIQPPSDKSNDLILKLANGTIHPVASAGEEYRSGSFDSLVSRIQSQTPRTSLRTKEYLMGASNEDLRSWSGKTDNVADRRLAAMYAVEVNRRLAFPLTVLLYPFIVFPAAVSSGRHGKITAFSGSLLLFLMNFLLFSVGSRLAYQGMIPAALGAWFPVIFLTLAGLAVFPIFIAIQLRGTRASGGNRP